MGPVRHVAGIRTELVECLSRDNPKKVLVFIPGNPGVISFYAKFLQLVYDSFGGTCSVIGVGYAGHHPHGQLSEYKVYSLEDQIQHKLAFLDQLDSSLPPGVELILLGHSIGAYICLEVMRRWSSTRIAHVVSIFPCIRDFQGIAPLSIRVMLLPGIRHAMAALVGGLSFLPSAVSEVFLRAMTRLDEEIHVVAKTNMINFLCASNVLYMGRTEYLTVKEWDEDFLLTTAKRLSFVYTTDDFWAPVAHYNDLKQLLPDGRVHLVQDVPHAFSLAHSADMSKTLAHILQPVVSS